MVNSRAIQFMGLNAVRVLSIISLILVFASTILVIVTNVKAVNAFEANKTGDSTEMDCDYIEGSTVPNQPAGVFWAIVSSLLIMFQSIILFFSEISWPMAFFDKFFPVLGTKFGLGALGIFQALISTQILSHHVDDFSLVAAFFLFALACINMLLGLIFRESAKHKRSVRTWRAEAKGVLPTSVDKRPQFTGSQTHSVVFSQADSKGMWTEKAPVSIVRNDSTATWSSTDKAGFGFGRQGEKAAGLRGFILQKPEESLPRYASPSPAPTSGNGHHVTFSPQPTTMHVNLSRASSASSSTHSSFYSPNNEEEEQIERERAARYTRRDRRHRQESHSRESSRSRSESERSVTPVKSSRPAAF